MSLRGRLVALGVAVTLILAGSVVLLLASRTTGCALPAPRPSLPPVLRALGDFDQSYDITDVSSLNDAASRAAGALDANLIGAVPEQALVIAAARPGSPDAVVVPLRSPAPGNAPLLGLVVFLRDCQGGAYFASVEDDAAVQPALTVFPTVDGQQAEARLGSAPVRLEYTATPVRPEWVTLTTPALTLPAR